jgi:peptide/nickel transport system substrate-binding protein
LLVVGLVTSGCGGKEPGEVADTQRGVPEAVEAGLDQAGEPVRGGSIAYGVEAETTDGWCLPEAQLAVSGLMVARAVYDTLTVPNDEGEYVPWLAQSVEPNETYDEGAITLRGGVEFHDGTALDSTVVKNNLDAVRDHYPARKAALGASVFHNIDTVEVVDPLTVRVTTHVPWVAFPAYLYSSGRYGMMAQSQLDDPDDCNKDLVGTGPFKLEKWEQNQYLRVSRNEDYWLDAPDGEPYPYLDAVEFHPITEQDQRLNALQTGQIQAMHTTSSPLTLRLRELTEDGEVNTVESSRSAEVLYVMLNASEPPFDDIRMRRALQVGLDRETLNRTTFEGVPQVADGPFAEGVIGHLDDPGWPEHDPDEARRLVEEYRTDEGLDKVEVRLTSVADAGVRLIAEALQADAKEVGIDLEIVPVEQSTLINNAIGGNYQATIFRNHAGGDPDTQYIWWKSKIRGADGDLAGNIINFGRIDDPEIDRLLDAGRIETDPDVRQKVYEDLNRRFAEQAWNIWITFTPWTIATDDAVHGIYGPALPDGSAPDSGLASGHTLLGMWTTAGAEPD